MKLLNETYVRLLSIALPAYWLMLGVCHVLGLKKHQNFIDVRHIRAGNLYFHLSDVLQTGYSPNDTEDFIAAYTAFITRILSLVDSVDDYIDFKSKNFSSPWLLKKISDLLFANPISRIDSLTALAVDQKETNPIEAGMAYLHQSAVICEMLRYAPMPGSDLVPKSAAILAQYMKVDELEKEAFVSDWINRSPISTLVPPERMALALGELTSTLFRQERDRRFSVEGFESALKNARKCFSKGKISELSSLCLRALLPLSERKLTKMKDLTAKLLETQQEALEQHERFGEERFGTYFRVKYYGEKFPNDIRNREFIFREAMAAKLPDVTEKIRAEASIICGEDVELLKDSSETNTRNHAISITFVKMFRYDWEDEQDGWLSKV